MLNLRKMPEAQNNIDRWGNGGGYFSVVTKGKKNDDISESVANVLTRIVVAKIFYPLGHLSVFTVKLKIMFQSLILTVFQYQDAISLEVSRSEVVNCTDFQMRAKRPMQP